MLNVLKDFLLSRLSAFTIRTYTVNVEHKVNFNLQLFFISIGK